MLCKNGHVQLGVHKIISIVCFPWVETLTGTAGTCRAGRGSAASRPSAEPGRTPRSPSSGWPESAVRRSKRTAGCSPLGTHSSVKEGYNVLRIYFRTFLLTLSMSDKKSFTLFFPISVCDVWVLPYYLCLPWLSFTSFLPISVWGDWALPYFCGDWALPYFCGDWALPYFSLSLFVVAEDYLISPYLCLQ